MKKYLLLMPALGFLLSTSLTGCQQEPLPTPAPAKVTIQSNGLSYGAPPTSTPSGGGGSYNGYSGYSDGYSSPTPGQEVNNGYSSSGDSNPDPDPNSVDGWVPSEMTDFTPVDGGNYGKVLRTRYGGYSTVEVRVELNTVDHTLKNVSMALGGITKFKTLTQKGDGVLTSYDAGVDVYHFNVGFVVEYADGTINNGIKTLVGWVRPSTGESGMKILE